MIGQKNWFFFKLTAWDHFKVKGIQTLVTQHCISQIHQTEIKPETSRNTCSELTEKGENFHKKCLGSTIFMKNCLRIATILGENRCCIAHIKIIHPIQLLGSALDL